MVDLSKLPPLRDVIRIHELRAEKKLGQNFLLDLNLTDKIVRSAGDLSNATIFEIGPGPGGLTRSLLACEAEKIIAIEYDSRAIKALQDLLKASDDKLNLIHGDALNTDLTSLSLPPRHIIANLPYNIATPLLMNWLQQIRNDYNNYSSMTLMFQREVAERIVAQPNTKAYGRLAVMCQWLCDVKLKFDVPASAFTPPPKVTSSIVNFKPKLLNKNSPSFKQIEKMTFEAFGQRRKMIRTTLKNYSDYFDEVGLEPTIRAEDIPPEKFIELAKLSNK